MDGIIHRTKIKHRRRAFPWGDIIIWAAGILSLAVFFQVPDFLAHLLYGIGGVYIFSFFILIGLDGFVIKTGKKLKIDKGYLFGSILMIVALFTAMHIGFTASVIKNGHHASFASYLRYCYEGAITPGGIIFGVPSYLLLIMSGQIGSFLLLGVFFVIGLVMVLNRAIVKRGERKILALEEKQPDDINAPMSFDAQATELYEKLQIKHKELVRESRHRLDTQKSLLGLGAPLKKGLKPLVADEPVPLSAMESPEEINQDSLTAAEQIVSNLRMYNDGKVIPWQPLDGSAWSAVNPVVPPNPLLNQPYGNIAPLPSAMSNPLPTPMTPLPSASPWEQPNGMQWRGATNSWTPPAANVPDSMPVNTLPLNPTLNRRKNAAVLKNIENQTYMPLDEPLAPPANTFKNQKYNKPSLDLIHTQSTDLSEFNEEASEKENKLNALFQQYNVRAHVSSFSVAPAVTRFEIVPETGTRVSQIENLRDDINFTLGTNNTRIENPIEGKNAIGIEVPNRSIGKVSIKDILGSREFQGHPSPLTICLGKNINDEFVVGDLAEMPHLLVAGTTGSGKSVCINTILTSLIYKTGPEELKLLLIDMKGGTELGAYNGLPHMLVERCITNGTHAVNAFKWLIREMNHRYDLLQGQHVNNIALYQALPDYKNGQIPAMPYIVMVIDEVADLMNYNKKEVEDCIQNLAQKSRAAGIHIVLATQRPSVNVISGVIKANIGTRIAFRVINGMDSRTILDTIGAETLMGRGDMLFMNAKGIQRVQGCYLENDELHRVTSAVREKNQSDFDVELEDIILNGMPDGSATSFGDDGEGSGEQDPKFVAVLRYAVREANIKQTLSISEIQRKFSVGFGRAGRIMDQLERAGYVGADFGNGKPREVLVSRDQVAEQFGL